MENKTLSQGDILRGQKHSYEIEEVLGQGSFGVTYKAKTKIRIEGSLGTIDSNVYVAVKEFFMKEINGREGSKVTNGNKEGLFTDYRKKFLREADNLSKLKHPHIINVLETFEANGTVYYSMEYIDGGSLDDLILNNHRLSETETIEYAKQIASALEYMHKHHVLHLDVKPSNIMLRQDSDNASYSIVLIDFGLSKQYDKDGIPESSTTVGGGTPGYAPIEQSSYHEGKDFPVTMDVYALGATMYKMLVGRRPSVASVVLNEGFPMDCLLKHNVSNAMASIVKKAMMPRKNERFQSVFDLRNELENLNTYKDEVSEETHIDENNLYEEPKDNAEKGEEINISQNEESEETYVEEHLVIDETVDKIVIQYKSEIKFEITPNMLRLNHSCPNIIGIGDFKSFVKALSQIQLIKRQEAPHNINVDMNTEKVSISLFKRGIIDKVYSVQTHEDRSYGTLYGNAQSVWLQLMHFITSYLPLNSKFHTHKWYDYPPHINNFILKDVSSSNLSVQNDDETVVGKVLDFFDNLIFDIKWKIKYNWKSFIFLFLIAALFLGVYKSPLFPSGRINGHSYVDLGLSVKWAATDIGNWCFCEHGAYFKWGEINPTDITSRVDSVYSIDIPNNDIAGLKRYDAATLRWGESWRMPTISEIKELKTKCKWKWISLGANSGYLVTGPNGKQIFLPISYEEGGFIWSSTLYQENRTQAYLLGFDKNNINTEHYSHSWFCPIRPVTK